MSRDVAKGYWIAHVDVADAEAYKAYVAANAVPFAKYGARYLVRGGRIEVLEGDWRPPRLTVLRYPDFESAKAMYDSPAYVQARALRHGATACFNMVLVEGVDTPA